MHQDHRKDFYEALDMIRKSDSLAISRCADGEAGVLKNNTIGNKDGWLYKKDKNLIFRADLRESLTCTDDNFIYGISSRNVDEENYQFLRRFVRQRLEYMTFSDIWVNANYELFNQLFLKTIQETKRDVVFVTNPKAKLKRIDSVVNITDMIPVKGNCITTWEKNRGFMKGVLDLHASLTDGRVFLVAAGPLTNIIIYHMWRVNQKNIYIDIGSTLDPLIYSRKSRNYHKDGHPDRNVVDAW